MNSALSLLAVAFRQGREGAPGVPETVLERLVASSGARAGRLAHGGRVLARLGEDCAGGQRFRLSAGRDEFDLELEGGAEPDEELRFTAGVALSAWVMREELKKARFAERRRLWEVESLRAIAEVLGGTLDPTMIAETIVLHATALLDARRGEVWLGVGDGDRSVARLAGAGAVELCADGTCSVAARVGGAVLTREEAAALPEAGLLEDGRLAVPVAGRRGRLGVVALAEREVRGGLTAFAPTDAETLALFASQAAVALENASLHSDSLERQVLERELELAASIQRGLLPTTFPTPAGIEVLARNAACRHVGGDVYDLLPARDGDGMLVMVGDVAGKGVPAALMASSLHAAVHLLGRDAGDLARLIEALHAYLLASTPDNKFATIFLGFLRADGELEYASAGHNPVLIASADGSVRQLFATGPPLGLLPDARYTCERVTLRPGALLVAYTDGLSEAPSPDGAEDFGVERLAELATEMRDRPLRSIADEIFESIESFTDRAPAHDDRTLVLIRRAAIA